VNKTHFRADESLEISFDLTNTGELAGKEAVQVYIHSAHAGISRPEQELKAFEKVELAAGETRKISFRLPPRAFAYYETKIRGWHVEGGDYEIRVGASSRDIRLTARVTVKPVKRLPVQVTPDTILSDLLTIPGAEEILMPFMTKAIDALLANNQNDQLGVGTTKMFENTLLGLPLHALQTWVRDEMTDEIFSELLEKLQALDSEV
jgi:beta-glucosidase